MKTALITGISGQDGSYLAQLLLSKGYRVVGVVRDISKASSLLSYDSSENIQLVEFNMLDKGSITDILRRYRPAEIYNLAAVTSGTGMFDDPVGIGQINGLAVTCMLEAIREIDPDIRFCQASSREIFGESTETPQTECTRPNPRSPYGAAKLYADSMIKIYRHHYGVFACSAILFNHESPRRGIEFVTRKITSGAVKIKLGIASELHLGNLDTLRDWGFAGDYVRGMWLMLQQQHAEDYVLATGLMHSVREFCECAFNCLGLDYRTYVKVDPNSYRPSEISLLVGNAEKAKKNLNWEPTVSFSEMIAMMVESDLHAFDAQRKI